MVMMLVLLSVLILIVMMVMMLVLLSVLILIVMMVMMLVLLFVFILECHFGEAFQFRFQRILTLHDFQDLSAGDLIPIGSDDGGSRVLLTDQSDAFLKFFRSDISGS